MQRLEFSCAVWPIYGSLGAKGLMALSCEPMQMGTQIFKTSRNHLKLYVPEGWCSKFHTEDTNIWCCGTEFSHLGSM
jgi:hypothetical protein